MSSELSRRGDDRAVPPPKDAPEQPKQDRVLHTLQDLIDYRDEQIRRERARGRADLHRPHPPEPDKSAGRTEVERRADHRVALREDDLQAALAEADQRVARDEQSRRNVLDAPDPPAPPGGPPPPDAPSASDEGDDVDEALRRFEPSKANLPDVASEDVVDYLDEHTADRPWLASAKSCSPEAQRVLAALDKGGGHALERHEGFADEERLQSRLTDLHDPAQLDPDKRASGVDAYKPGDYPMSHLCSRVATSINEPETFAKTFARGIEHPDVRAALDSSPLGPKPRPVDVPIADLLGNDERVHCIGYRLQPVGGSADAGRDCRDAWVGARIHGRDPDVPPPRLERIDSFEHGQVKFVFARNETGQGWEIRTMFVEPLTADEDD